MDWITQLLTHESVAQAVLALSLVIALGLGIARFGSVASRTVGALTAIAGLSLAFGG